jgi:glycerate 2-kinase
VGAGKASLRIAEALEDVLGDRIDAGVVVVREQEVRPLRSIEVIPADHPLPSARSVHGARRLLETVSDLKAQDIVIACVTGGSSALVCLPPENVSLDEKRRLHLSLLECGADITEINTVRKHVSLIKGGRLAHRALPARIVNLTVSDVAHDPFEYVTDLTVNNTTTPSDAIAILHRYDLWKDVAKSIRDYLSDDTNARMPDLSMVDIQTVLLVNGDTACTAMAKHARRRGLRSYVLTTALEGEARDTGRVLAAIAEECASRGRPFDPPCAIVGCGGEATVTLRGEAATFGEGGPNQESALSFGLTVSPNQPIACVMIDTDGSDGGGPFAGAVVDSTTRSRAVDIGLDPRAALASHRSLQILSALADLVRTGPTGTNVNDLFVIVVGDSQLGVSKG